MLAVFALGRAAIVQWCIVAGWVVVLSLAGVVIDMRWRHFQSTRSDK